jgi:hypothetical protein
MQLSGWQKARPVLPDENVLGIDFDAGVYNTTQQTVSNEFSSPQRETGALRTQLVFPFVRGDGNVYNPQTRGKNQEFRVFFMNLLAVLQPFAQVGSIQSFECRTWLYLGPEVCRKNGHWILATGAKASPGATICSLRAWTRIKTAQPIRWRSPLPWAARSRCPATTRISGW